MSEIPNTQEITEPVDKPVLAEKVYRELIDNKDKGGELLSKIKWSLSLQKNPDVPDSDERRLSKLEGNLRGAVAEEVSNLLGIDNCETVFISGNVSLGKCSILSPHEFVGSEKNTKASVIYTALIKALDLKPIEIFGKDMSDSEIVSEFKESRKGKGYLPKEKYGELLRSYLDQKRKEIKGGVGVDRKIEEELREDYRSVPRGAPDEYSTLTSEAFNKTVIPDGFLVREGSPVGLLEVKAYEPDELATLMQKIKETGKLGTQYRGFASDFGKNYLGADKDKFVMGADFNKETEFVDFIRGVLNGEPNKNEENILVLRFPNDIPDNLLNQFGQMIVDYGYPNVLIQKLPLSNQELTVISKEIVNASYSYILLQLGKDRKFSNKEIDVLDGFRKS
ncbi:hypothetical protein K0B04_00565 [Patescibacteria group bacterium]|nr:hypothetical protein [Patescibacteria group bacterium]